MDPTPLCSSSSVLQIYLVVNWPILNDNVKTHLFLFSEFRFAAFPGKTIRLSITGKSPATTLILAGTLRVLLDHDLPTCPSSRGAYVYCQSYTHI